MWVTSGSQTKENGGEISLFPLRAFSGNLPVNSLRKICVLSKKIMEYFSKKTPPLARSFLVLLVPKCLRRLFNLVDQMLHDLREGKVRGQFLYIALRAKSFNLPAFFLRKTATFLKKIMEYFSEKYSSFS